MLINSLKILPLRQAFNISLAVVALALASQCAIPFYYVPLSLQTLAVTAVAFSLTPGQATFSTLAWMTSGAMGAPVFANFSAGAGVLLGTSGGYLWGMLVACFVMSWCRFKGWPMIQKSRQKENRIPFLLFLATAFLGGIIVWTFGWTQLQFLLGGDGYKAWCVGLAPFIVGDSLKIFIVSLAFYYSQKSVGPHASSAR